MSLVEGYVHLMDAEGRVFVRAQATFEVTDEEIINVLPVTIEMPERLDCTLPLSLGIVMPVAQLTIGDPDKREMPDAGTNLLLGSGTISKL